jgi:succinate dehydrogenase subunit D
MSESIHLPAGRGGRPEGPGGEHRVPKTAFSHLIFWFLFAQGGIVAAILIPAHVLVQGILGPLGVVTVVDRHYDTWVRALGNPIVKLYLLVLIAVPFFHFAHRIRYLLVDLGLKAAKSLPAQVIFYGGAVLVTLVTIWVLLTTVPLGS